MDKRTKEEKPTEPQNYPMLATPVITYRMVHDLECKVEREPTLPKVIKSGPAASEGAADKDDAKNPAYAWNSASLMIIFEGGDLNSAMHYLLKSLHDPFAKRAVATLLIQESQRDVFLARLVDNMRQLDAKVANHPNYLRTLAKLQELKAETIVGNPKTVSPNATPMLVSDLTHNFLGEGPTGVITMHTFRTPKEATLVNLKETLAYRYVSIWNEKLAGAYEICALLKYNIFLLNCFNADLSPILPAIEANQNDAKIVKGYHYECLTIHQVRKVIVFPVGTVFAN